MSRLLVGKYLSKVDNTNLSLLCHWDLDNWHIFKPRNLWLCTAQHQKNTLISRHEVNAISLSICRTLIHGVSHLLPVRISRCISGIVIIITLLLLDSAAVAAVSCAWVTTHFLQLWRRWRGIPDRSAPGKA